MKIKGLSEIKTRVSIAVQVFVEVAHRNNSPWNTAVLSVSELRNLCMKKLA